MIVIGLLRGVNVGGTGKLPMEAWRAQAERLGFTQASTYIQSGNIVFVTREKNLAAVAAKIETAVEQEFGFRRPAILRTREQLRDVVARSPFPADRDPAKLVVYFLAGAIDTAVQGRLQELAQGHPEEVVAGPHELFIYFPHGQGRTRLPLAKMEKALGVDCTARNWNTVAKLLAMAEELT